MPRRKKKRSIYIDRAQVRSVSLRSVNPALDFGEGLTLLAFEDLISQTRQLLDQYNFLLTELDRVYDAFKSHERAMNSMNARMLTGVATRYGKDSLEYEMAGGSRRPNRQIVLPTTIEPATIGPATIETSPDASSPNPGPPMG